MTRRNRSRLPPRLPDAPRATERREAAPPTLRDQLKRDHVAGRSARFGREEMLATMRRVTTGSPRALLGAAPLGDLSAAQVQDAVCAVYGWEGDGPRARISASCTIDGFDAACSRVLEVARDRRRIAFATARPASLLPLYRDLAAAAAAAGADVATATESGVFGTRGRRLRWLDHVAVATDGVTLLGDDDPEAAEELLFTVARPDLVVADRCFAGVALRAGFEVVAFADLDAAVLAVAAHRGRAVRVIPLDERRPPSAYEPLRERLAELLQGCLRGQAADSGVAAGVESSDPGVHTAL